MNEEVEAAFAQWCARRKAESQARRAAKRLTCTLLACWPPHRLRMPRAYFQGQNWQRAFDVQRVPIAEVDPVSAKYHRPGKRVLVYDFTDDVRELVCEPIRHDVYAMWSDPWESWGR
jgi:hypothetical protein